MSDWQQEPKDLGDRIASGSKGSRATRTLGSSATAVDDKEFVHLAGEYYTTAELHRRQVHATITYGNAKSADVLAFSLDGERFARVEVKSSRIGKGSFLVWTGTSERFIDNRNQFWVLCLLPNLGQDGCAPRFFVLTAAEMRAEIDRRIDAYTLKRAGAGDPSRWMWTISLKELVGAGYEGAWHKISEFLGNDGKSG